MLFRLLGGKSVYITMFCIISCITDRKKPAQVPT